MKKIYNFSAETGNLPDEVIEKANKAFLSYEGASVSILELTKNSPEYEKTVKNATKKLRQILNIPSNYKVLFMNGGAAVQHSAIPLNILSAHKCADYVISGQSSKRAYIEAKKYGDIVIAASSAGAIPMFSTVPEMKLSDFRPDADYVFYKVNNTGYGTKFHYIPDTGNIPLVADMSSFLLSEPVDISKYALIYATSDGNMGPVGLTVVIIRDDIVGGAGNDTPGHLNYKLALTDPKSDIIAPVWNIYLAGLLFDWIIEEGGLEEIKRHNERKASLIYDYLDTQQYYTATVDKKCRSMVNVVFTTGDALLDKKFIKDAKRVGLINLSGDDSLGGMRASIYNTMPIEGVEKLVSFMKDFSQENPKMEA